MALPASGLITAADINVELGRASTAFFNLNGADERALAEKASGLISFSDFHGKSAAGVVTLSSQSHSHQSAAAYRYIYFDLRSNGIAEVLRLLDGFVIQVTPVSGEWHSAPYAGIHTEYEVRWTHSSNTSPVVGVNGVTAIKDWWYTIDSGSQFRHSIVSTVLTDYSEWVRLEVRDKATNTLQAAVIITLSFTL